MNNIIGQHKMTHEEAVKGIAKLVLESLGDIFHGDMFDITGWQPRRENGDLVIEHVVYHEGEPCLAVATWMDDLSYGYVSTRNEYLPERVFIVHRVMDVQNPLPRAFISYCKNLKQILSPPPHIKLLIDLASAIADMGGKEKENKRVATIDEYIAGTHDSDRVYSGKKYPVVGVVEDALMTVFDTCERFPDDPSLAAVFRLLLWDHREFMVGVNVRGSTAWLSNDEDATYLEEREVSIIIRDTKNNQLYQLPTLTHSINSRGSAVMTKHRLIVALAKFKCEAAGHLHSSGVTEDPIMIKAERPRYEK